MRKTFFIAIIIVIIGAIIIFSTNSTRQALLPTQSQKHSESKGAVASVQTKQYAQPARLSIPKLGVDASVESVGMDNNENMDIPKNADNVAWYNLGYKPGEKGNAVIAGHFDKVSGAPAVFYHLENLHVGDRIVTTDVNGDTVNFSVVRLATYTDEAFPLEEVFGQAEKSMLNLITCDGTWNSKTKSYSHRTVVYAELVE